MTWAQLRSFLALAETGSVHAAADRLLVTDSAISAAVATLQRDLGVPLVVREGRGVQLSESGLIYASYARRLLGLLDEARAAAVAGQDPTRGRLRLAAVTSAGEHLLPSLLAAFRRRCPAVDLTLEIGTSQQVWALLAHHEADLVIGGRPPGDGGLVTRATRGNDLVVVDAPHADGQPEPAGGLAGRTWLLREAGSGTRATTETLLEALGIDPPRLTLGANGAVIAGAVAGLGVTLVSLDAVRRELDTGELRTLAVTGTPLRRPWHAVTRAVPPATTDLFVEHLLDPPTGAGWRVPRPRPLRGKP